MEKNEKEWIRMDKSGKGQNKTEKNGKGQKKYPNQLANLDNLGLSKLAS